MSNNVSLGNAVDVYHAFCDSNGFIYQQPNALLSEVFTNSVRLKNINGTLATVNFKTRCVRAGDTESTFAELAE